MEYKYEEENARIEDAARRFYEEGDAAARIELMGYLYDETLQKAIFSRYNSKASYKIKYMDEFVDIYIDAMLSVMSEYNPKESDKFMPFFWKRMPWRTIDKSRKKKIDKCTTNYTDGKDDDDSVTSVPTLDDLSLSEDQSAASEFDKMHSAHEATYLYMAVTARLNALRSSHMKSNVNKFEKHSVVHAEATARFIKSFSDEDDAMIVIKLIEKHHDEVYKAIDCEFLDYFTVDKCDTLRKLFRTPLKKLGEVADVSDAEKCNEICGFPLGAIVYIKYYALHNITASDSSVSNQRTDYYNMNKKIREKYLLSDKVR